MTETTHSEDRPDEAEAIKESLQRLDGHGWIRASIDKDEHTGAGCDVNDLTIFLDSQLHQHHEKEYTREMVAPEDFPAQVQSDHDELHLKFHDAGVEIERFSVPHNSTSMLCRNESIYTDTTDLYRHFPNGDVFKTDDYFIYTKYHDLPVPGNMNVWVERHYETHDETVLNQTDVESPGTSEPYTLTVSLIKHDEPATYEFAEYELFHARVQIGEGLPIIVPFDTYDDATAFYGLIREIGTVPNLKYEYDNRHIVNEGWSTDRMPIPIAELGKPAIATFLKTATTFRSADAFDVAHRMGVGEQTVWNYVSEMRYDPLKDDTN